MMWSMPAHHVSMSSCQRRGDHLGAPHVEGKPIDPKDEEAEQEFDRVAALKHLSFQPLAGRVRARQLHPPPVPQSDREFARELARIHLVFSAHLKLCARQLIAALVVEDPQFESQWR